MSHPHAPPAADPLALLIRPSPRSIGEFDVLRALPVRECRAVGPFVFFDQMGPAVLPAGRGLAVRPHPHIGLATVTWLFEGEIRHQDSLGSDVVIRPGEVNWMTAGSGIVHSERSPEASVGVDAPISGVQVWLALPVEKEELAPAFAHFDAEALPCLRWPGLQITLIIGAAWQRRSPVEAHSETLYAEVNMSAGARLLVPDHIEERAVFVHTGAVLLGGLRHEAGAMLVLQPGVEAILDAPGEVKLMLLGGAPLDGERHLFWNFVSSSKERIEQAKDDWRAGRFAKVPGDDEHIPLP